MAQEAAVLRETQYNVTEEPITIKRDNCELWGVLYHAKGVEKGGVLICSPDGEERIWTQRVLVNFSRLLASNGFTVLRFDHMGQGESGGNYEDATLTTRLADIELALKVFRERTSTDMIGLLGVRFGGTLAILAASQNPAIRFLVLWEPVLDVGAYLYDQLRVNISTQMVSAKRVLRTREQLMQDILSGRKVSINGFGLAKGFFEQAREINLENHVNRFSGKLLLVLRSTPGRPLLAKGETICVDIPNFWNEPKVYHSHLKSLTENTLRWMRGNVIPSAN